MFDIMRISESYLSISWHGNEDHLVLNFLSGENKNKKLN